MDVVTHTLIGAVAASPFYSSDPICAASIVLGNVIPDLDTLARLAGKRAFLRAHQTLTHALPSAAAAGVAWGLALHALGLPGLSSGLGLATAMALHALLDYTNTYGVALWWPWQRERRCREWIFFIDATTVVLASSALALQSWLYWRNGDTDGRVAAAFFVMLACYTAVKAWWRTALGRRLRTAMSLVPSALWPWRFFACGYVSNKDTMAIWAVDAMPCREHPRSTVALYDHQQSPGFGKTHSEMLESVAEYRAMRALSPAYHVTAVAHDGDRLRLHCQDLRTRNFATTFGELDVTFDADGSVRAVDLKV